MEAAAKIEIKSRELIKPSSQTLYKELQLSLLDQCMPHAFVSLLFFYQNRNLLSPLDPPEKTLFLKQSLSECLTKFYPLAGKLNDDHTSILCDDSGVLFVEAKVHASLSEAVKNAPYEHFGMYLPVDCQGTADGGKLPPRNEILVAVQISWFECGGNVVGVSFSHRACDLMSFVTFMNSWAAINRGESVKLSPNFDIGRDLFPPGGINPPPVRFPYPKGKMVCRRFLFSKEKLTELKQIATVSSSQSSTLLSKVPTRVEVVTAFLMKQFINMERAKNTNVHNKSAAAGINFMHAVNFRSRMSSLGSLSSKGEFPFGNFIIGTSASLTPDHDNQENLNKEYGELVWLAKKAIEQVNENYVVRSVSAMRSDTGTEAEAAAAAAEQEGPTTKTFLFTSWCRFSTYEADFGWGNPISVGRAGAPISPVVTLTSTSNEEGIEARIYMLEDGLDLIPDELLSLEENDFFFWGIN